MSSWKHSWNFHESHLIHISKIFLFLVQGRYTRLMSNFLYFRSFMISDYFIHHLTFLYNQEIIPLFSPMQHYVVGCSSNWATGKLFTRTDLNRRPTHVYTLSSLSIIFRVLWIIIYLLRFLPNFCPLAKRADLVSKLVWF